MLIDAGSWSDDARLNPECHWHASSVIATLRAARSRLHGLPPQVQEAATDATNRRFYERLKDMGDGRMGEVGTILRRRARRWSEKSEPVVQAMLAFARSHPPPEFFTPAMHMFLYAWCTAARFAHRVCRCLFCELDGSDSPIDCAGCPLLGRWVCDRFGVAVHPGGEEFHAWLCLGLGCEGIRAYRAVMIMDSALHSYDGLRHGSRSDAMALLDACLKEARRSHKEARGIPADTRWLASARRQ